MRSFFASVSQQTSAPSSPYYFQDGEVQISKDLIEMAKNNWSAVVTSLAIFKSAMEPKDYHQFLVVEIVDLHIAEQPPRKGPYYIRAEKLAGNVMEGDLKAKIKIQETFHEGGLSVEKFKAAELDLRIPVAKILDILGKPSPDYNILSSNCWNYAHDTLIALFNALEELHPDKKRKLRCIRTKLPELVMPDEVIAHTVVGVIAAIAIPVLTVSFYKMVNNAEQGTCIDCSSSDDE